MGWGYWSYPPAPNVARFKYFRWSPAPNPMVSSHGAVCAHTHAHIMARTSTRKHTHARARTHGHTEPRDGGAEGVRFLPCCSEGKFMTNICR